MCYKNKNNNNKAFREYYDSNQIFSTGTTSTSTSTCTRYMVPGKTTDQLLVIVVPLTQDIFMGRYLSNVNRLTANHTSLVYPTVGTILDKTAS
jgi:hypothetical protein